MLWVSQSYLNILFFLPFYDTTRPGKKGTLPPCFPVGWSTAFPVSIHWHPRGEDFAAAPQLRWGLQMLNILLWLGLGEIVKPYLSCSETWNLPGPGIEPTSPVLAGGFLTTGPSGKTTKALLLFPMWPPLVLLGSNFVTSGCCSKFRLSTSPLTPVQLENWWLSPSPQVEVGIEDSMCSPLTQWMGKRVTHHCPVRRKFSTSS